MIERTGNLFDTAAPIIGHGVNVDGIMGAGIAKQFREIYPKNYKDYRAECADGGLFPGSVCGVIEHDDKIVLNFASQDRPGRFARYDWLFSSLYMGALAAAAEWDGPEQCIIAIPEIGCGIGGLKWKAVAKVILAVEAAVDNKVEFEVWHYDG